MRRRGLKKAALEATREEAYSVKRGPLLFICKKYDYAKDICISFINDTGLSLRCVFSIQTLTRDHDRKEVTGKAWIKSSFSLQEE